jgi:hypothetical protein
MRTCFKRNAAPARAAWWRRPEPPASPAASAHAVVGDRVFPATMTVDDPGVNDEFDTQFGHIASPDGNGENMNVNTVSYEWDKTITQISRRLPCRWPSALRESTKRQPCRGTVRRGLVP